MNIRALIVGGGIGGLAAALACSRAGAQIELFERFEFKTWRRELSEANSAPRKSSERMLRRNSANAREHFLKVKSILSRCPRA